MLDYNLRKKITSQALAEINFARNARRPRVEQWRKNEDLYYNKKIPMEAGKINVNLNEMKSFVDTFVSKINAPYNFTFVK